MSNRLHVCTRKGLFTYSRDGDSWELTRRSFVGDSVSMCLHDPRDNTLYACLSLGHFGVKLRRSVDEGATWEEVSAPQYPEQPETPPGEKEDVPWKLGLIWCLESAGADLRGSLWCGTIPGGLFRSDDRGESWNLVRSLWDMPNRRSWFGGGYDLPGIHSVDVDPRNSDHVLVGVSCGGAWASEDGGESWENRSKGMFANYMPPDQKENPDVQDPHRIIACASEPDTLWCQHHNAIFRTTNRGRNWAHVDGVEPSDFGLGLAVHPGDPNTAWFAPAIKDECRVPVDGKLVITRTRDGGRNFETLRDGLPQEDAYDLVYRHALDVSCDGGTLAFGSTTGSLFISKDAGDRWTALSTHLPPIYCVRFATA